MQTDLRLAKRLGLFKSFVSRTWGSATEHTYWSGHALTAQPQIELQSQPPPPPEMPNAWNDVQRDDVAGENVVLFRCERLGPKDVNERTNGR